MSFEQLPRNQMIEEYLKLKKENEKIKRANQFMGLSIFALQREKAKLSDHLLEICQKGKACADELQKINKDYAKCLIENIDLKNQIQKLKKE